jgi:putative SOS response-associated peptidase YedK
MFTALAEFLLRGHIIAVCGRYTLIDPKRIAEAMTRDYGFEVQSESALPQSFNVAPSQLVPIVRADESNHCTVTLMRWGLIPFWDKTEKPKIAPINARSEDALNKPMFRQSLQKRRAVFICDGFFEWQASARGPKTPFHIQLSGGRPFVIAGMYEETSLRPEPTCALLTVSPNALMAPIHNRMPAILDPEPAKHWLRPGPITAEEIAALCQPYPAERMTTRRVSAFVNNVRNNGPECVQAVD